MKKITLLLGVIFISIFGIAQNPCPEHFVDIINTEPQRVLENGIPYINVCWDEENNRSFPVTFTAQGRYSAPHHSDNLATFIWDFRDNSTIQSGIGLTTVNHVFQARRGYTVGCDVNLMLMIS